jgi:hypothetical protein
MNEREIFNTPCWNFIGGDRQIERILRELPPGQPLVVRNRLANVLPTVAGLADLRQLDGEKLAVKVNVPENAVVERAVSLDQPLAPEACLETLLSRLYGIQTVDETSVASDDALLVAIGFTDGTAADALAAWLDRHPALPVVFLLPPGAALAPALRSHAVTAWSAQHWSGLNAFSMPTVEEAIAEHDPQAIVVAAAEPAVAAYTAIGAVDAFIREVSALGAPGPREILELGRRVRVLRLESGPSGAPVLLREWLRAHLEETLGVVSVAPDPRYAATGEAIAIDIA